MFISLKLIGINLFYMRDCFYDRDWLPTSPGGQQNETILINENKVLIKRKYVSITDMSVILFLIFY